MNIALSAAPGIWTPLLGLLRWFAPATTRTEKTRRIVLPGANAAPSISAIERRRAAAPCAKSPVHARHRPLRIVRILEADQTPSQVGRMVISGRMADVCAELDRLAAGEAIQP